MGAFLDWFFRRGHTRVMPLEPSNEREYTTQEAADILGKSIWAVIAAIKRGTLKARKFGKQWAIKESDLAKMPKRKAGRPKKGIDKIVK